MGLGETGRILFLPTSRPEVCWNAANEVQMCAVFSSMVEEMYVRCL